MLDFKMATLEKRNLDDLRVFDGFNSERRRVPNTCLPFG